MWFIGAEVGQETSAPPPKKNPGSAPVQGFQFFGWIDISLVNIKGLKTPYKTRNDSFYLGVRHYVAPCDIVSRKAIFLQQLFVRFVAKNLLEKS